MPWIYQMIVDRNLCKHIRAQIKKQQSDEYLFRHNNKYKVMVLKQDPFRISEAK